ncbi:hypothetical protein MMKA1_08910 [Methanococcus maripaludis KA1]|uniref:Uncharacterized protein n=1 Tax=Methanococcus maripaludis KA1 TaxID=637914 RepID=A0A2Z5PH02_METMI|nr:hypothetical protein [Methanococcus maripaludis]BAP61008.1 hypothetical protein MMKA1_08910 [Methanococcus maripaludis KA1]
MSLNNTYLFLACIAAINGTTISDYGYSETPFHAPTTYNGDNLTYDSNGNLIEDGEFTYIYNDANQIMSGDANAWDYLSLGADLVCLALPVATGGGLGVRAIEQADNVADLFKWLDTASDVNKVDNAKDLSKLDWDSVVSNKGETRIEHVNLHVKDTTNPYKSTHGIFNGNPVDITNDAWAKKGNIEPIVEGTTDVYHIPYENAGTQGGKNGNGEQLNQVTIVTKSGTNQIITAYPSKKVN